MPLTAPHQLTIATRESQLALWQAHYVRDRLSQLYPRCQVEILGMTTTGDQILDSPLNKVGGKGLFVKELEVALQNGQADIAVHSMKDVPMELPEGFDVVTVDEREDARDAFVSNHYGSLDELPAGSVVGTSSLRRESQVRFRYPNLEVVSLRGNVQTRLKKLDNGGYHAVLLAAAGLKRLGLGQRIRAMLSVEQSLPAVGQGALAIEFRAARSDVRRWLAPLSAAETSACLAAERAMSRRLAGSCNVPLAAHAQLRGGELWLQGMVAMPDGSQLLRDEIEGGMDAAETLGVALAEKLLERGAGELLQRLSK